MLSRCPELPVLSFLSSCFPAVSRPFRHALTLAAVVALVGAHLVPALAAPGDERQLADAERRIDQLTAELEELESARKERSAAVQSTRVRVDELEEVLNDTLARIQEQRLQVSAITRQFSETEAEATAIEDALGDRVRAIYMRELPPALSVVFSGGDVQAVADRMGTLQMLNSRDGASVEMLTATRARLEQERVLLGAERGRLEAMREEQQRLLARVMETLSEQSSDLAAVQARESALVAEREDLEGESERLEALIEAAQNRAAPAGPGFVPSGRGYIWPLCGAVTSEFGPRWGRMHEGIDIDGVTGDPLRAANDGIVISAGWSGGYGKLTLIDHGDGVVTAYAHQSRIEVTRGQRVSRGQFIGAVGATGNVTGDHLHYETRVGGRPTNPRTYLRQGC